MTVTAKSGTPDYHSIIIAREDDSDLTSLDSLKGHTFAFVDPSSTSGSLMPKAAMMDNHIDPENDLKKVIYSGGHDASIIAVAEGKVDAASVADRIYAGACDKKAIDCSKIKVIWTSPAIPNDPLFYRKAISDDMKKKIRDAFYGDQEPDLRRDGDGGALRPCHRRHLRCRQEHRQDAESRPDENEVMQG